MAKEITPAEPALFKYNKIKYSFVDVEAGQQHVLTSDPWSYLTSHLQTRLNSTRGNNKSNIQRALYFAKLAEDFYRSADVVELPAKGTLLYYGMLDLVKSYLCLKNVPLETTHEHHGMSLPLGRELTITVSGNMNNAINIFSCFSETQGRKVAGQHQVDFRQALSHVPEIHGIYNTIGQGAKRKLLPVTIDFLTNDKRDKLFTEISFDKEQEAKVDTKRFSTGRRATYFRDGCPRPQKIVYRSARRKSYTKTNIGKIYRNILKEYRSFDIVPILTPQGYRYYVDLRPGDFSHLSYALLAMFYLGSAARYRPLEIKSLLEGPLRPLVSEFVSLTPRQFLYQMVSLATNRECVIPFSAI
jgi:hypothetical protein